MTSYSFYLCKTDGSSTSMEVYELATDADVAQCAEKVLAQHPKSAYVAVWDGERPVLALENMRMRRRA